MRTTPQPQRHFVLACPFFALIYTAISQNQSKAMSTTDSGKCATRHLAYNIYVYKKPDMEEDAHHHHVEHVNSPIITSILKKYGAILYSVVRIFFCLFKQK